MEIYSIMARVLSFFGISCSFLLQWAFGAAVALILKFCQKASLGCSVRRPGVKSCKRMRVRPLHSSIYVFRHIMWFLFRNLIQSNIIMASDPIIKDHICCYDFVIIRNIPILTQKTTKVLCFALWIIPVSCSIILNSLDFFLRFSKSILRLKRLSPFEIFLPRPGFRRTEYMISTITNRMPMHQWITRIGLFAMIVFAHFFYLIQRRSFFLFQVRIQWYS